MKEFDYGEMVMDTVTGYVGKVTAYADYYGKREAQYLVEGIDSTGRPIEWWVPENRVSPM